ncbi:MAG TPA: NAD(P)/FAD-dependent oxidoreductase, partial [Xanthomonadales bacterium]|nr:NAD(P)/FAD-dependent oxidoreductase [Xanthomonadales bacterium]
AAGAALGALPGCGRRAVRAERRGAAPVAIVGAGIAGLTAAYRLRDAGVPFTLYEAQDRIGGRMLSLRGHFADGQVCELGGELIDTGHVRIRALAAELGIELDDLSQDDPKLVAETWYHGGRAYGEREVLAAFAPLAASLARTQATLPDAQITYREPGGTEALDALTISQWLDREGASGWLRELIEVAYTTEMGLECEEQSALNLLTFIDSDANHLKVFGESDERFHVRGGNDLIVQKLAERVADAIETGSVLEAISRDAGGDYVLSVRRGGASREVRAPQVVLALPFTLLRKVKLDLELPEAKRRAIAEARYGTNAKLMIGYTERVWRTRHGANGSTFTDLPLQTTWETSRLQPGASGILTNFTGGKHGVEIGFGTAREQADKATRELDAVFPGVAQARAGAKEARMHWPTNPWVLGSYLCYAPGQWTTLRGAFGERVGELRFAGEHCSFDNQGFMEGGCETGEAVAAEIVASRTLDRVA